MALTPRYPHCQLLRQHPFGGGTLSPATPAASESTLGSNLKLAFHRNLKRFSGNVIHVHLQAPPAINQGLPSAFQRLVDCSGRIPLTEGNEKGIRELSYPFL
jgi:hypothetical protein